MGTTKKKGQPVRVGLDPLETRMDTRFPLLVPGAGLEPARLAAGDFESPASTNFTTRADCEERDYDIFFSAFFKPNTSQAKLLNTAKSKIVSAKK